MDCLRENDNLKKEVFSLSFPKNKIRNLDEHSFKDFDHLTRINLSNNKIENIGANTFSNLKELENLELYYNCISKADFLKTCQVKSINTHEQLYFRN
jgi:hypothetical protein